MEHRKHGTRLLGVLAAVVLGVLGFAASAQAVTVGILTNKTKPTELTTFGAEIDPLTLVTMLVPGLEFQLTCNKLTVDEGKINSSIDANAVLLLTGEPCTTLDIKTKVEIACEVVEPITVSALFLPAELTNGEPALLAEKVKALIKLTKVGDLTKPCPLPEDNTITGEVCFKITAATNETIKPLIESATTCKNRETLEGKEVTSGGVPDLLKYGGNDVTLHGQAVLFLTGKDLNLTLGVKLF